LRIGVAAEGNKGLEARISMHFGRCPYYVIVEADRGEIKQSVEVIINPYVSSHGQPGQVPFFLKEQGIDVIIAGGMGPRAKRFFNQYEIRVITEGEGKVKEVVEGFLKGQLKSSKPCH
jgi:predicted Fe-Mo cluster-binding NifX family protein